eukprot:1073989-Prorocentrum_minimum.AAC.1
MKEYTGYIYDLGCRTHVGLLCELTKFTPLRVGKYADAVTEGRRLVLVAEMPENITKWVQYHSCFLMKPTSSKQGDECASLQVGKV